MEDVRIVLVFLVAVVVSTSLARLLPVKVPLPLLQIALGACLAWFGLGVPFEPQMLDLAEAEGVSPGEAAGKVAEQRILDARHLHRTYL